MICALPTPLPPLATELRQLLPRLSKEGEKRFFAPLREAWASSYAKPPRRKERGATFEGGVGR